MEIISSSRAIFFDRIHNKLDCARINSIFDSFLKIYALKKTWKSSVRLAPFFSTGFTIN